MKSLTEAKERLLADLPEGAMRTAVESFCRDPRRPLGKLNPWAWWVALVHGCNLRCWHCATRLFPPGEFEFMGEDTFRALLTVIQETTPYGRLEFGQYGEPTLHPQLLDFLRLAKEIAPHVQVLIYTNGTQLTSGKLTYGQLFDAGLNCAFVDMYAPRDRHAHLAEESGVRWFFQSKRACDSPNIFTYQNDPSFRAIMLVENPDHWARKKADRVHYSTFLNDLDWPEAMRHGLTPTLSAPQRRCDIPSKFPTVNHDGTFLFCCNDFLRHSAGRFGNIEDGLDAFLAYWLGGYMQETRAMLDAKDRRGHEYCSRCSQTTIRCDIPYWRGGYEASWNGTTWETLAPVKREEEAPRLF